MKTVIVLFLAMFFISTSGNAQSNAKTVAKQKVKKVDNPVMGKWKGEEKCKGVSAPTALLFLSSGVSPGVNVSGIYSIQGNINATIKGDTLVIPRQEVKDPNFMNMVIEGKLAFMSGSKLSGNIIVINNQVKDECMVTYYK